MNIFRSFRDIPYDYFCTAFRRFVQLLKETGSINRKKISGRSRIRNKRNIEAVRQLVEERP